MTLTKFEAELRLNDDDMYASMKRRVESMIMAAERHQEGGKNKNAGIHAALMTTLYEIDKRMRMAYALSLGSTDQNRVAVLYGAELRAYYPIIRKMYDQFAASRLLQPSEVTESTMEGHLREIRQRERDNPIMVYAHDEGCTIDHIPNGPRSNRKNCPTPEEWDD
jgi:hypothetical protein